VAHAEFQHSIRENLLVSMDARVKPAHDEESAGCRIDGVWLSTAYL
jgi:hypothetical protein